ncbi:MAG: DNA-3-methyladenine glycosylase 2 family protein [Acidimicrobiales bacterium]
MPTRQITPPFAIDLRSTLRGIQRGVDDPTMRFAPDGGVWRATRTPKGPATLQLVPEQDGTILAKAWGSGARWALRQAPRLIGCEDDDEGFPDLHPVIVRLRRRFPGLRMGRTDNVLEALVPAVLEQRVTGFEATRAFRQVVTDFGEPAPGPGGLMLPPHPDVLAGVPYYELHVRGVERRRADTLRRVCARSGQLTHLLDLPSADAQLRMCELRGIGVWTAAEVARVAFGDTDAISLGDYNLPTLVSWALTGDADADDARMVELLEPWRGHRGRIVALLEAGGLRPPRTAPRAALRSIASS